MTTLARRASRAAMLDPGVYEEVEHDARATPQAIALVLLASAAGGVGLTGLGAWSPASIVAGVAGALAGWMAWAALTYLIGTHLLPEPQTRANLGELLRTIAFASTPGVVRVFGVIPGVGRPAYIIGSVWMLIAMVIAVRQALDYRSSLRAIAVCVVGWALSLLVALIIGMAFITDVS